METSSMIIKISSFFDTKILSTREAARIITEIIQKKVEQRDFIIDFSKIDFVSRSFADEIVKEKKKLEIQDKHIEFRNVADSVQKMIDLVSHVSEVVSSSPSSVASTQITSLDNL